MNAKAETVNVSFAAKQYITAGLILVPFDRGQNGKGPQHRGWNKRENCIATLEQASNLHGNIGVALLYSRLVSIDLDDIERARAWFMGVGIDLDAYWEAPNAVRITSGRPNRGKILYRLPAHIALLVTRMFKDDGVELRCATASGLTVQDVLPPSVHPLTGEPYQWMGPGSWRDIPEMPADLLAFWLSLFDAKATAHGGASPAGIGREDMEEGVYRIAASALAYDEWLHVGMALHHETSGNEVGLEIWDQWSQTGGKKYKGRGELESKWSGFQLNHPKPRTLRTIEYLAGKRDTSGEYGPIPPDETVGADATTDAADPTGPARAAKFMIESATEFADCEYEDDFIDGVLPDAAYGVIMGQSGAAKTFVAIDLAFAMAHKGGRWRGRDTKPARVLYIAAEGAVGVRKRLKAYAQHHGIDLASIDVEFMGAAPDLTKAEDVRALIDSIKARASRSLSFANEENQWERQLAYTHIIIDTWSQVTPGADENNSRDMGAALKKVQDLHRATGARILFVAHMGKDVTKGMRGWSGFKAAMDYELEVTRYGDQRTLTVSKSRDGQDGTKFPFHLHPVTIGVTKRGKPVVSCVVTHDMAPPKRRPTTTVQIDVLAAIESEDGAWMPFEDVLQKYKKRRREKKGGLQPKKDQSRLGVKRALLQLTKKKWIEEKDGNYRPFPIPVDL